MDFEKRAEHDKNDLASENLIKEQKQLITALASIIKECEELLITCKDVLKYTPASNIMRKRIDEVLNDISRIDL